MNISILTPTRIRPDNIDRLINSALDTAAEPTKLEFIFYIDNDDNLSEVKLNSMQEALGQDRVKYVKGDRIVLSEMWNKIQKLATADIMMHCGDDIIFRTQGWDDKVLDAFNEYPDKIVFVHGDDGFWGKDFGTHGFIHIRWVNTTGYFVPPYFSSDYNDTWLNDVSNGLGRRKYIDILTEHMHPNFRKAEYDQNHKDRLERHRKDRVDILYHELKHLRDEDIVKLKSIIENYNR